MKEVRPIKAGNMIVNKYFWPIFTRYLLIMLSIVVFSVIMNLIQGFVGGSTGWQVLSVTWLFYTIFFGFLNTYTFHLFRYLRSVYGKEL